MSLTHDTLTTRRALLLVSFAALLCSNQTATPAVPPDEAGPAPAPAAEDQPAEDEDLAERLIRQATGDEDEGVMDEIMRLMAGAAVRLDREFDPGKQTQTLQQRIVDKLDEAIATAQRRKSKSSSASPPAGDRRTTPPENSEKNQKTAEDTSSDQPADGTVAGSGSGETPTASGRFRESRRGWGHLPDRDRDEILQGIDEDVLEKYRRLIDDYYRALAEEDQE